MGVNETISSAVAPPEPAALRERLRARMAECELRRPGTCGRLDLLLGYEHAITMDECDACFAAGGGDPHSPPARAHQVRYVQVVVRNLSRRPERLQPLALEALIRRHLDPDARPAVLLEQAPRMGRERSLRIAAESCPSALPELRRLFEGMSPEQELAALDPVERWARVASAWAAIEAEVESGEFEPEHWHLGQKAVSLLKAKAAGRGADHEVVNTRNISCFGTDLEGRRFKAACPALRLHEGEAYCAECGCGYTRRGRLGDKLTHKKLPCPRAMPGFSNARITIDGKAVQKAADRGAAGPAPA